MGKICTVAIHKGGTGKTTIAAHLAFLSAERGARTLLVDVDAQGNATDTVTNGLVDPLLIRTASDLFELEETRKPMFHALPMLDVLPADARLMGVERLDPAAAETFAFRLRRIAVDYDLVVVDTPPTMGFGMLAPLLASDFAIAPIVPDAYSLKGIESLITRIEEIRASSNPSLVFIGLLINKWRKNSSVQNQTVEDFRRALGSVLIPHALPEAAAIADAAHHRKPVWRDARWGSQRTAGAAIKTAMSWVLDRTNQEIR